ncbi:zinc finger protein with KRAB and SCAN domains 8-like isoform X3 [Hemicordylus capensis]|uniref:zinc finger protein with KRAB and SCAN domains 8-like isoform X3 n=1 Tax=Hemicordylus capensis TaxID=884348 RepID=UPI0023032DB0|nr:zinc finger protein with KRAB and SCAN domains 8-like isoform X3 [Hemicordylus capensis]
MDMEEQLASPELESESEGARKPSSVVQCECLKERPGWRVSQEVKWEPCKGVQQHWETQWQEFLKAMQAPHAAWGSPPLLSEATPWDDAKAFLASFEQVAEACQWPREEWATRLLPALSGEAKQAFSILEARDREDYGKVKAAILRGDAIKMEVQRQHFRQFRFQEVEDPRRVYSQLQELCRQWLKPEKHTKEQILELLILEQFLTVLPHELQNWVREGSPENCAQATTLVEDFLMSQQNIGTWKWQEPLQEIAGASLDAEGISSDADEREVYKEAKESGNGDIHMLGSGGKCPSHSDISPSPEGQETAKTPLTEELMSLKETGVSLHMVERTPAQPGQQTMFWQVMQENGGNAQSLEGLLVPKPDLASHPEKTEEMFLQFPMQNERHPGHDAGDEKKRQLKMEDLQQGELGMLEELSQWNFPTTVAIREQRCDKNRSKIKVENSQQGDEKRSWIKMENLQQGTMEPEEPYKTLTEISPWNFPVMSEIPELRRESGEDMRVRRVRQQEMRPVEGQNKSSKLSDLTATMSETSAVHSRPRKPLFLKHGITYNCRLGLVMKHPGDSHCECPMSGESIQQKSYLDTHQRIRTENKLYECSECGKSFYPRSKLLRHQKIHTGESPYECLECGKSFTCRGALMVHQIIHTGEKPFECPQCGKCFNQRTNLLRHQRIHTGEKVHVCPKCGKNFYRKDKLMQHQRIHTGEKPYVCPECGKTFTIKDKLRRHQITHLG